MRKHEIKALLLIALLASWATTMQLQAQSDTAGQIKDKMEMMLDLIAVYDYEQSRSWQQEFQDLMKQVYNNSEIRLETEKLMNDFLRSDATKAGKQMICKELGIIGSEASVSVLSVMLDDPGLSGTAILALEKIPGENAGKALKDALGNTHKGTKITVINSIAVRKDEQAIPELGNLIHDSDTEVARAAVAALGNIGSSLCAGILEKFFYEADDELIPEVANSLIKCADNLLQKNELKLAAEIYEQVYDADPSQSLKHAALIGKFLISETDPYLFIANHLKNEDPGFHRQVIGLVYQVPDPENFGRLFSDIPSLPVSSKLYLINTLADVHDFSVRPEILEAIQNENQFIRIAAIKIIPQTGLPSDARLLASIAAERSGAERDMARESLYILAAENTNDSILAAIESANGTIKSELIRSTGERNMKDAITILIRSTSDPDQTVRTESIRALGILAPPDSLPEMIEILIKTQSKRERLEAERAIFSLTQKLPPGSHRSIDIIKALKSGTDQATTVSLINILGQIGDKNDLPVLQNFLESEFDDIQLAVIKALSGWPDASPLEDLKEILVSTADQRKHTLALRGCIEVVISDRKMNPEEKLSEIKTSWRLASNIGEKKIVISGLNRIHSTDALEMALQLTDEAEIKKEAEAAVLTIAERTSREYPEKTKEILRIFLSKTDNEDYKIIANHILERIQ